MRYLIALYRAWQWQRSHSPCAPKPRIIAAVLRGEPLPREPLEFG